MRIVTDSGTDTGLSAEEAADLGVIVLPLVVTLDGTTYRDGLDIGAEDFYSRLAASAVLPTTSQPPVGDFVEVYRRLAETDPEILSIHMSSGLSGTYNAALAAAKLVPEAKVTHVDTKTLSAAAGWQVLAAAKAAKAGWSLERVLALVSQVGAACQGNYTLSDLTYLIHGGRISHMKGLIASVLNIKPVIGVDRLTGKYVQKGQARSFGRALGKLTDLMLSEHSPGSRLLVQVLDSHNPEGAAMLREKIDQLFDCTWIPTKPISLVLGAHTGPSMVSVAFGPMSVFGGVW